jgi:hypothetical protein
MEKFKRKNNRRSITETPFIGIASAATHTHLTSSLQETLLLPLTVNHGVTPPCHDMTSMIGNAKDNFKRKQPATRCGVAGERRGV